MELGCDPTLIDAAGRVPYMLATDKATRNTFRRFMGTFPDRYDYGRSAIPSPLTDDIEQQKAERLAEKRKLQKQVRKEKQKLEAVRMEEERRAQEEQQKIEAEKFRFLNMSDREKVYTKISIEY